MFLERSVDTMEDVSSAGSLRLKCLIAVVESIGVPIDTARRLYHAMAPLLIVPLTWLKECIPTITSHRNHIIV
jgi:hypothetical protein